MKATVGIYDSHEKAFNAVKALEKAQYPLKQVSLLGKAEIIEDHMHVRSRENAAVGAPIAIGAIAGPVVGLLTGIGIFAIPGLGFLYGAGAIIGALAGLDFGIISGIIVGALTELGLKKEEVVKYEEHIKEGNFIVVVQGTDQEIEKAKQILHTEGQHVELNVH